MKYRKGYKMQVAEDEVYQTTLRPRRNIITARIELYTDGRLVVKEGYASDGASGPAIDRKTNLRGAIGHDALYELMRKGLIHHNMWSVADRNFERWLLEDGTWRITAWAYMKGLRIAKGKAALPKNCKKVHSAP